MKPLYLLPFWIASLVFCVLMCNQCKDPVPVPPQPDTTLQDQRIDSLNQVIRKRDDSLAIYKNQTDSALKALALNQLKVKYGNKKLKDLPDSALQHFHDSLMEQIGLH